MYSRCLCDEIDEWIRVETRRLRSRIVGALAVGLAGFVFLMILLGCGPRDVPPERPTHHPTPVYTVIRPN